MLLIAKRISNFLQFRPILIIFFWSLASFTFFMMTLSFELMQIQVVADSNVTTVSTPLNEILSGNFQGKTENFQGMS
ncbi:hypothetical protein CAEBREN_13601 [Caenorhabditis brenneri]|uniref:Uncharacterized protein n=1 Tax=Caenorhabditis brenneri TaxID=135651 RepID=G0NXA3_CAEBE|nr:hypothetical protein CAEBREN_13601 [Caenorhabditis brenneri]